MAIEHKDLPESGLHEPKGVSTAASKRVYRSDGAGSGAWSKVDADTLAGTIANSSPAGERVVTDGAGGFATDPVPASSFGTMNLTDNATTKTITAATDPTLNTDSDYQVLDLSLVFENTTGMTAGSNYLQVDKAGLYLVDFWANVSLSVANTRWALKFVVNDIDFVKRSPKVWVDASGEFFSVSANGIHTFSAGDQVKLYIASDKNVDMLIEDMTFQMVIIGDMP